MEKWVSDILKVKKMSKNSRLEIQTKYSQKFVSNEVLKEYDKLLKEKV